MPVFHPYKSKRGAYLKAHIKGAVVTLQLTDDGVVELISRGICKKGDEVSNELFRQLIRSRDAYTLEDAPPVPVDDDAVGQEMFDYVAEVVEEGLLPRCQKTGSLEDLHLVVYREGVGRRQRIELLSGQYRRLMAVRILESIPLWILDLNALDQLIEEGHLPEKEPSVVRLRQWFEQTAVPDITEQIEEQFALGLDC